MKDVGLVDVVLWRVCALQRHGGVVHGGLAECFQLGLVQNLLQPPRLFLAHLLQRLNLGYNFLFLLRLRHRVRLYIFG